MKQPFSLRRWFCARTGHRMTRRHDVDGYGRPFRVCWCGLLRPAESQPSTRACIESKDNRA